MSLVLYKETVDSRTCVLFVLLSPREDYSSPLGSCDEGRAQLSLEMSQAGATWVRFSPRLVSTVRACAPGLGLLQPSPRRGTWSPGHPHSAAWLPTFHCQPEAQQMLVGKSTLVALEVPPPPTHTFIPAAGTGRCTLQVASLSGDQGSEPRPMIIPSKNYQMSPGR